MGIRNFHRWHREQGARFMQGRDPMSLQLLKMLSGVVDVRDCHCDLHDPDSHGCSVCNPAYAQAYAEAENAEGNDTTVD